MNTTLITADTWQTYWKPRTPRAGNVAAVNRIMSRTEAMQRRFIELNRDSYRNMIVLDLDRKESGTGIMEAFEMVGLGELPPFNWVTESKSGGAHIGYVLADGVAWTERARLAPREYFQDVRAALTARAGADHGYVNYMTYNPLHPMNETRWLLEEPWTLGELHKALCPNGEKLMDPNTAKKRQDVQKDQDSRALALFDELAPYAWAQWAKHYNDADSKGMGRLTHLAAMIAEAHRINNRDNPVLPLAAHEVESTARSVNKWTWNHFHDDSKSERKRAQAMRTGHAKTRAARIEELRTEMTAGKVLTWQGLMDRYGVTEMTARSYLNQLGVKSQQEQLGELDQKVRELLFEGMSYTAAAEALGVTMRKVRYSAQRQGIKPAGSR